MANEEHLEILKRGVRAWNRWKEEHPDTQPDLSGTWFAYAKLARAKLHRADFTNANLRSASLRSASLRDADLSGANLSGATPTYADLRGANLSSAKLIAANLSSADLRGADLNDTDLNSANLSGANLSEADLSGGANLRGVDLGGASLHGANLHNANLRGANLHNANLSGAYLNLADLISANLRGANLTDTRWDDSLLDCVYVGNPLEVVNNRSLKAIPWRRALIAAEYRPHSEDDPHWLTRRGDESLISRALDILAEAEGKPTILRSIEFPPEYREAGVSILSYFATILEQEYPDAQAKVTISQEGRKVKMVIETLEGNREEIERTLEAYGLVVRGEMAPEEFLADPLQVHDLRTELKLMQVRLESKNELLAMKDQLLDRQKADIEGLRQLVGQIAGRDFTINVNASPSASATVQQAFHLPDHLRALQAQLQEASKALPVDQGQQFLEANAELAELDERADKTSRLSSQNWRVKSLEFGDFVVIVSSLER